MKKSCISTLLFLLVAGAVYAGEFVSLFDGKTTDGWQNPYEWGDVKVEDGAISLEATKKFFLVTEKKYKNFIFEAEVMLPPEGKSNSGVMFRCHVEKNKVFGYQAECDPSARAWTGGLYDEGRRGWLAPSKKEKPAPKLVQAPLGEWIKYKIQAEGNHLQIFINGKQTTDYKDDTDAEGHIGIQHHGEDGQVYKFRNLRIKEL